MIKSLLQKREKSKFVVEVHGWITIRETYEATDEENFEMILKN